MSLSIEGKIRIGVVILLSVLIINGFISYRAARTLIDDQRLVLHSHQTLAELETTLSTVKDAETGERGYIITDAQEYLEPYHAALGQIDDDLRKLKQLNADNPEQQARIPLLEQKISDRLRLLKTGIDLRTKGDEAGIRQLILSGS